MEMLEQRAAFERRIGALVSASGSHDPALSCSLFTEVYMALGRARGTAGRRLNVAYAMMVARRTLWREVAATSRRRRVEVPLLEVNIDRIAAKDSDYGTLHRDLAELHEELIVDSESEVSVRIAREIVALVMDGRNPTQATVASALGIDQSTVSRHWKSAGRLLRRLWLN